MGLVGISIRSESPKHSERNPEVSITVLKVGTVNRGAGGGFKLLCGFPPAPAQAATATAVLVA
jgi:hypothetical protein